MIYKLYGLPFGGCPRVLSRHPTLTAALRAAYISGLAGFPEGNKPARLWIEEEGKPATSEQYRNLFHRRVG